MSNWFKRVRCDWIVEMIGIYGYINREHVMRKFGVSTPQASYDLCDVMREHPDIMSYDTSAKRYVATAAPGADGSDIFHHPIRGSE